MPKETKHISFDLWMTLIRSGQEFKKERAKLFCSFFNLPQAEVERAMKVFRETDLLVNRINETVGKNVDALEMYMLNLDKLGVDMSGIRLNTLQEFYDLSEQLFFQFPAVLVNDEIIPILNTLKDRGYTLNILSNTGYIKGKTLRRLMDFNGVAKYMDFQVYSDEVACSKPSPIIFDQMYRQAQELYAGSLSKRQVVHIGDNKLTDVEGATGFGINAFLVDEQSMTLKNIENGLSVFVA
jgi:putative hydrolase of the HAD superfamily